jgi:hypothetical protein
MLRIHESACRGKKHDRVCMLDRCALISARDLLLSFFRPAAPSVAWPAGFNSSTGSSQSQGDIFMNELFDRLAKLESNPRDPDEKSCRPKSAARSNGRAAARLILNQRCLHAAPVSIRPRLGATRSSAGASREVRCLRYTRNCNLHLQRLHPIDARPTIRKVAR